MIFGFRDRETQLIYNGIFSSKLPIGIQRVALRKLMMLDNAENIIDLRVPPSNHLEKLKGDRSGQFSIRINEQYRLCFSVIGTNKFYNVEIIDYH